MTAPTRVSKVQIPQRRNPAATRRALLDATLSLLAERGESGVRVTEVARRAGTTTGAIYSHFRDRAELLAAAYVDKFEGELTNDIDKLEAMLAGATDRDSAGRALLALVIVPDDDFRRERRWQRIEALAATRRHPGLVEQFARMQGELERRMIAVLERAQVLGLVAADVDLRSVAALIQAIPLGLVMTDLDPANAPERDAWLDVVVRIAAAFAP
ncbi:MAG: TetR/AcrR family transcriptional regulator [Acidimicrobiia bacterium]